MPMKIAALRIGKWAEACHLADQLLKFHWIFRGQQDASWLLSTALHRAGKQGNQTSFLLSGNEEKTIEIFQRRAHHFLPHPPALEDRIEWMALMQHFGGPTRLLDFTHSFYVAAFFATEQASSECSVWCVNHHALYKRAGALLGIDIDAVLLPHWEVPHRFARIAQALIRDKSRVQGVFEVQPFRLNERLAIQQGLFLCPISVDIPFMQSLAATFELHPSMFQNVEAENYNPLSVPKLEETAVIKIILPPSTHHDALEDLWGMNISAASLFPGLDGFARSLHYFFRVDNLWHTEVYPATRRKPPPDI